MTSKIKVDNIENQCGGAVVTKCGGTTTISGSVVKSNTLQASDAGNIISQSGTTITLGASGDTINLASGASQSGFGRTGTVDWDTTPKTATFTAVSGNGYFCNTSGGAFTVNLPAGSAGAIVSLADYAATWQTNNVTVAPNGTDKMGGENNNVTLNTEGQSVTFVYVDSTQGWINTMDSTSNVRANAFIVATGGTITCSGNCRIHTFTGPGTFTVTNSAVCAANNVVSYLVVAGGASGGGNHGGGGGAGGFREVKSPVTPYTASPLDGYPSAPNRITVTAAAFPITVGGGGSGFAPACQTGTVGGVSTFSTITSAGGGGGASQGPLVGASGGSGGGGAGQSTAGPVPSASQGGTGNTPSVSPAQGTNGGFGIANGYPTPGGGRGGGGGGATVAGSPAIVGATGGPGGAGATTSINNTPTARAGGGGGSGAAYGTPTGGTGGTGGGGNGASAGGTGSAATVNTGGGGGGGYGGGPSTPGGAGGSGIVIIRYKFQ